MVLIFCGKTKNGFSFYRDSKTNVLYQRKLNKFEEIDSLPFNEENGDIILIDNKNAYQMTRNWNEVFLNYGDIESIESSQSNMDDNSPKIRRCRKKSDFFEIPYPSSEIHEVLLNNYIIWGGSEDNFLINFIDGLTEYSQKLF